MTKPNSRKYNAYFVPLLFLGGVTTSVVSGGPEPERLKSLRKAHPERLKSLLQAHPDPSFLGTSLVFLSRFKSVAFFSLLLFLIACTAPEPSEPLATPFPTVPVRLTANVRENGLFLITMDGVRQRDMEDWIDESILPTFGTLAERGHFVSVEPVEPTLAESALVSLLTGQLPLKHQWVGLDGIQRPPVVPFWANQSHLYTVLVGPWPSMSPELADAGIAPGEQVIDHALHEPLLVPAQAWEGAPPSFSPRLEATLPLSHEGEEVDKLFLLAVDTLNDNLVAYDQYWLTASQERRIKPDDVWLDALEPGWVTVRLNEQVGVDLLLREGRANALQLYQSAGYKMTFWPSSSPALAPYPPELDIEAYHNAWLSLSQLEQMALRQTKWLTEAALRLWKAAPVDKTPLVAVRWPAVGTLHETLLLVEPTQLGWEPSQQTLLHNTRRQLLSDTDTILGSLLSELDLSRHTLFVTSPLGVEPVWYDMSLPLLLQKAGLNPADYKIKAQDKAAWLGLQANSPPDALLEAVNLFIVMTDESTQQLLFEEVRRGQEMIGQAGENWYFLQVRAGYLLSTRREGEPITSSSRLAASGGSAQSPDLSGWWLAIGQEVRAPFNENRFNVTDISDEAREVIQSP